MKAGPRATESPSPASDGLSTRSVIRPPGTSVSRPGWSAPGPRSLPPHSDGPIKPGAVIPPPPTSVSRPGMKAAPSLGIRYPPAGPISTIKPRCRPVPSRL